MYVHNLVCMYVASIIYMYMGISVSANIISSVCCLRPQTEMHLKVRINGVIYTVHVHVQVHVQVGNVSPVILSE